MYAYFQLFNIHADQSETTDVSDENPEVVDMLLKRIIGYVPLSQFR